MFATLFLHYTRSSFIRCGTYLCSLWRVYAVVVVFRLFSSYSLSFSFFFIILAVYYYYYYDLHARSTQSRWCVVDDKNTSHMRENYSLIFFLVHVCVSSCSFHSSVVTGARWWWQTFSCLLLLLTEVLANFN